MKTDVNRHARTRGFTLIEILVVVVILAILAAVVVPNVISRVNDGRVSATLSDIKAFDNAIDSYKLDTGSDPPSLDALVSRQAANGSPRWAGPYLKNQTSIPKDAWGNPYTYKVPGDAGREYDISSAGPDGQLGTPDDIQSWNMKGG